MDILYNEDSVEVTSGLEESLESVNAGQDWTEDPPNTHCGKRKRKTTSHVWSRFDLLPLAEVQKRDANVRTVVLSTCVEAVMALVI